MKYLLTSLLLLLLSTSLNAQAKPIRWAFTSQKIGEGQFEIRIKAIVGAPWHIYSQSTPPDGPMPTTVKFHPNPLIKLEGKTKEEGKMVSKYEEVFGIKVYYYEGQVEFVQRIRVRDKVKTNVSGKITYMVCKNDTCLPPATESFTIKL